MRKFDYTFLKKETISSSFLSLSNLIHETKREAQSKQTLNPRLFTQLLSIAKVQSVKGSNAIEGIVTSDKRIAAIVNDQLEPINHDEQEIAGYRDALNLIFNEFKTISFSEKDILGLHSILLSKTGTTWRGQYKDNVILEIDRLGNRLVRFKPTSAFETPQAMQQLIYAYMAARQDSLINPLLLIPCVILDFLCIHPFNDGNGRISRLLSLLLMFQHGYDVGKYISFEQQINEHKSSYYEALKLSSQGWEKGQNDYAYFIKNFIQTLYDCYVELEKSMATVQTKKLSKEKRIRRIILESMIPLSKKDIWSMIPDVSMTMIELVLSNLLKAKLILKYGSFKDAKYKRTS